MHKAGNLRNIPSLPPQTLRNHIAIWWLFYEGWRCISCWQTFEITHENVRLLSISLTYTHIFNMCIYIYVYSCVHIHFLTYTIRSYLLMLGGFGAGRPCFFQEKGGGFPSACGPAWFQVSQLQQVSLLQPKQFMWFRHLERTVSKLPGSGKGKIRQLHSRAATFS